jgi:hypothetical protein
MTEHVICGRREFRCECVEPVGHDEGADPTPHKCDPGCGGSWTYEDGEFVVVTYPSGVPTGRPYTGSLLDPAVFASVPFSVPRGPIRFIRPPALKEGEA